MGENTERRRARRQDRGLRRQAELLDAAAQVFVEVGYDKATTNAIAARAQISPGSLYQFFPNKEAIAQALAARSIEQLLVIYDTAFSLEAATLPLETLLDHIIDPLVSFNRANPGLLALLVASQVSPELAMAFRNLHEEVLKRFELLIAARTPSIPPEQRRLIATVSHRIFLALLPLAVGPDARQSNALIAEMKAVLCRYLEPLIGLTGW
ncbi:MAG: TetR/AcrR family transcriptional regulator [Ktedonobacteraceae bacterium]